MDSDGGKVGSSSGPGGTSSTGSTGSTGATSGADGANRSDSGQGLSAGDRSAISSAVAGTTDAKVGAQADQVTGGPSADDGFDNADAAAPGASSVTAALGRPPSEGTLAEAQRRADEKVTAAADKLAQGSPTAAGLVASFKAAGGTFEESTQGGWFANDSKNPTIHVPPGTETQQQMALAHELGHFGYRNNPDNKYTPPSPLGQVTGVSDHQIEERREANYVTTNVNTRLADEGAATLANQQIRAEYKANTGIDIGVAGDSPLSPMPTPTGTVQEQRRTIGDYYGSYLSTSVNNENYRSYYGRAYISFYAGHFVPGAK